MNLYGGVEKTVAWICGMAGGCLAYVKAHLFLMDIWGSLQDRLISIAWAGFVAFFTGAMGVLGKRAIERVFTKRKK